MKKSINLITILPTTPGYDATIETTVGIFNLSNAYETETNFDSIDIYNEEDEHLDEFASGFAVDSTKEEDNVANLQKVADYIIENVRL